MIRLFLITLTSVGLLGMDCRADSILEGSADFTAPQGPLKRLNGINNAVYTTGRRAEQLVKRQQKLLSDLKITTIRLHDSGGIGNKPYIDPCRIFPMHSRKADTNDPDYYWFEPTDDYLDLVEACGAPDMEIIGRLGPVFEFTYPKRYWGGAPRDWDQFAEVSAGIMRHYLKGWGGGKVRNIRYWEIWNEPDLNGKTFWELPVEDFFPFYCKVAKRLKREFDSPDVKIGGPAFANVKMDLFEEFLSYCRKEKAPIDFFTFHTYLRDYDLSYGDLKIDFVAVKGLLAKYGYGSAEIHLNEWRYYPCPDWKVIHTPEGNKRWFGTAADGMHGIDAAAMTARCLTKWSATPLDQAHFYTTHSYWSFLTNPLSELTDYQPEAYPLGFFGEMFYAAPERVASASSARPLAVLASRGKDGRKRLLVSVFKGEAGARPRIRLNGVAQTGTAKVRLQTGRAVPKELSVGWRDGVLELPASPGSAVYFVEL